MKRLWLLPPCVFGFVLLVGIRGEDLELVKGKPSPVAPPVIEVAHLMQLPPRSGKHLIVVVEVIDGDTVRIAYLVEDTVRLAGINAPEIHGPTAPAGRAAKAFLREKLPSHPIALKVLGREKYGRTLGVLYDAAGKSVNDLMVTEGHALPWDGTGKKP